MARFLTDEHIRKALLKELRRRLPDLDLVRVQEVDLMETADELILAWAAEERRVVFTENADTMPGFAYQRLADGLPMAGVVVISDELSIGQALEELHLLIAGSREDEWEGRVQFLPH